MLTKIEQVNSLGWVTDKELATILACPLEAVKRWMSESTEITQCYDYERWRIEGWRVIKYLATYDLEIGEYWRRKRGRPRIHPKDPPVPKKLTKLQAYHRRRTAELRWRHSKWAA